MIRFFLILAVLLLAAAVGVSLKMDPGYVLIAYQSWTVEMPLWVLFIAILLSYGLIGLFFKIIRSPRALALRFRAWRMHRAHRLTQRGFLALAEWRWQKAKRYLIRSAPHAHMPVLNYLGAAKAAAALHESTEEYFAKALAVGGASVKFTVNLRRALQLKASGELGAATTLVESLYEQDPHHLSIIQLLLELYEKNGRWHALQGLINIRFVRHYLSETELDYFSLKAYAGLIHHAQDHRDSNALQNVWSQIPRATRHDVRLVAVYAKALMLCEKFELAEKIIYQTVNQTFDETLVSYYGEVKTDYVQKQLVRAEAWLTQYGESPALLLTLAKLAKYNALWGKAIDYAAACLRLTPSIEATLLEGEMYEAEGKNPLSCYKQGLMRAVEKYKV
jgi:HemY protein